MQRAHALWLIALGLTGCATMESQVRERAAHDFGCTRERLHMVDSEATVFRIAGCGSIATYRCVESPLAMRCRRASWDQPDTEQVTTAAGSYTLERRSLFEAEQQAAASNTR